MEYSFVVTPVTVCVSRIFGGLLLFLAWSSDLWYVKVKGGSPLRVNTISAWSPSWISCNTLFPFPILVRVVYSIVGLDGRCTVAAIGQRKGPRPLLSKIRVDDDDEELRCSQLRNGLDASHCLASPWVFTSPSAMWTTPLKEWLSWPFPRHNFINPWNSCIEAKSRNRTITINYYTKYRRDGSNVEQKEDSREGNMKED